MKMADIAKAMKNGTVLAYQKDRWKDPVPVHVQGYTDQGIGL